MNVQTGSACASVFAESSYEHVNFQLWSSAKFMIDLVIQHILLKKVRWKRKRRELMKYFLLIFASFFALTKISLKSKTFLRIRSYGYGES